MVDVSGSPTMLVLLHQSQKALNVKQSNPVLDVPTRFASTFRMLDYYITSFYKPMCLAAVDGKLDNDNIALLTPDRFGILVKIVDVSRPVVEMITALVLSIQSEFTQFV